MDDKTSFINEMMSNFDNLEDTMEEEHGSNTDLTQTMEYSVDIREITQHHKSRQYKTNLCKLKARLKSQLERVQRKHFDSDDSSADETTLEWLERLRRNRRQRPAIMQSSLDDHDDEDEKGIHNDALQRHTHFQSTSGNFEHDRYPAIQTDHLDISESESEPCQKLISRRGDEESCNWGGPLENTRRMVAESLGSLDPSPGDKNKGTQGKHNIKSSEECELKRVVRVKDKGSKTLRIYKKHEVDQTGGSTREEAVEIVEKNHSPVSEDHDYKRKNGTIQNLLSSGSSASQHQRNGKLVPASALEDSEDTDEILGHIQQLYLDTHGQAPALHSHDNDDVAKVRCGTEVEAERNGEYFGSEQKDQSDVKMFGKMNGGKRRFAKNGYRRARQQTASSSSENDNDSKDSIDVMLKKLKSLKKEHGESSSSTDAATSLLRRQTVRLMKRICKRSREDSENGRASGNEVTSNEATKIPSRKRVKRSTSPDIEVEETVQAHIRRIGKGTTYTRKYFQKRHRLKHFGKLKGKKGQTEFFSDSKENEISNKASIPVIVEDDISGPVNSQSYRGSLNNFSEDRPSFLVTNQQNPNHSQNTQDSNPLSPTASNHLRPSSLPMMPRKGTTIRVNQTPSFFIIPKDQRHPKNYLQTKLRSIFAFLVFILMIIALWFLITFIFFCNPTSSPRCFRCDIEFSFLKFIDSNSGLRHLKVPPI